MRRFFSFISKLLFFLTISCLLATIGALGWVYYLVVLVPCPEMSPENIASILGRESPVYYRDGQEKIGVLFQDIHRQYLDYEQIPPTFINAIVAAEDDQFFEHYGIDFPGIIRAMLANYKAGRIVQGGSTITQQTAKNLFRRDARNYEAKLKEMLYALRLEYRFSKKKILEFYSNQFYVSGNGHGLGVAARYYFDKNPADLTLLETAFIAGSVKRPNYYNPFIKKDKGTALQARTRAEERAEYVLGKMFKLGVIAPMTYAAARKEEIMFKRGKTSFSLNTIMDTVRDGLSSQVISQALARHGIENISTSGARIISTVDHTLQTETLYNLRRELSRLDVRLRGYESNEVQQEYKGVKGDDEIQEKSFIFGIIKKIDKKDPKNPVVSVDFGPKKPEGFIDRIGLERMLTALVKYRKDRWAKPGKKDLAELLTRLRLGDSIYVSVREIDFFDGTPTLELERYPKLQGGALVLQQGMIRAMAGGMDNHFFNRAFDAKRLMGSTFKPFLFAAALQLGWSPLDKLNNKRNVFVFLDEAYFPRPDHISPFAHVSMSWAGVKSENVAAVWLLYHLTDQLTQPQLMEMAASLDMAPRRKRGKNENYQQFKVRMRDRIGIHITQADLDQAAYEQAIKKIEPDFLFDGRSEEYFRWKNMPYGLHFTQYRKDIYKALKKKSLKSKKKDEYWQRISILRQNYLELQRVQRLLKKFRKYFKEMTMRAANPFFYFFNDVPEPEGPPQGRLVQDEQGRLIYTLRSTLPKSWQPTDKFALRVRIASLFPAEKEALWENILLEGRVSSAGLDLVERQMKVERVALSKRKSYSLEVLTKIRDYRVMLGLQYLIRLAEKAGVSNRLKPVLSFPLGSNVVSLFDSVRMYETLVTGKSYDAQLPDDFNPEEESITEENQVGLAAIERIEGPDGRVIYARQATVQ
ncbi:MAG: glycosyl transferase family 51, partial [Candidatus Electrothrix sp. AR3]|nr:glycosyl transferase family 51 [Candidatus Electrothrix sp. AR3]